MVDPQIAVAFQLQFGWDSGQGDDDPHQGGESWSPLAHHVHLLIFAVVRLEAGVKADG